MMPSSAKFSLRDITQLGILLAAALALRLAETSLAFLLPLPGAHLGLANAVTIIVLYLYGIKKAALFLTARLLLTGLLFTGLFTPGFLIGLGGALLSFIAMSLAVHYKWFSTVGVGLLGAFFHNCGQVVIAAGFMRTAVIFSYLPVLIAIGIPTGLFTGFAAGFFLKRLKKAGEMPAAAEEGPDAPEKTAAKKEKNSAPEKNPEEKTAPDKKTAAPEKTTEKETAPAAKDA